MTMGAPTAAISFARRSAKTLDGSRSHARTSGARHISSKRARPLRRIELRLFIQLPRRSILMKTYHGAARNLSRNNREGGIFESRRGARLKAGATQAKS